MPLPMIEEFRQKAEADLQPVVERLQTELDAFDVRIVHALGPDPQPSGDLRMVVGELRGQVPDVGQLALVVRQELVTHRPCLSP